MENKQKIIDLGKKYATSFRPCFNSQSSEGFIRSFAAKRFENTVTEAEIEESERTDKECIKLFIDEFTKNIQDMVKEETVKVTEDGKKIHQVKRKKD